MTAEHDGRAVADIYKSLSARQTDFATYNLPQLPEPDMGEVFERLGAAEQLFSPGQITAGYRLGSAVIEDELIQRHGHGVILTAEHATDSWRQLPNKVDLDFHAADYGTGALGMIVSQDTGAHMLAPRGLQTSDANYAEHHPLKEVMKPVIGCYSTLAHLSVHGMHLARVETLDDPRAFNVILGIGYDPTEETKDKADKILAIAKKYDLRASVNQTVLQLEEDGSAVMKNDDGSNKTITYAAAKAGTTRTFAAQTAAALNKPFASLQLELCDALRLLPEDCARYTGPKSQRIGTYLGYLFLREASELFTNREITLHKPA